jgi:hypothetical protein
LAKYPSQTSNTPGPPTGFRSGPVYVVVNTTPLDNVFVPFPVTALGKPSGLFVLNGSSHEGTGGKSLTWKHPSTLQSGSKVVVLVVVEVVGITVVVVVVVLDVLVVVVLGFGTTVTQHVVISHTVGVLHLLTQPEVNRITLAAISLTEIVPA